MSLSISDEVQREIELDSALLQCLQDIDRHLFDANRVLVELVIPAARELGQNMRDCDAKTSFLRKLFLAADEAEHQGDATMSNSSIESQPPTTQHSDMTVGTNLRVPRLYSLGPRT